jgi:hypothetical protein
MFHNHDFDYEELKKTWRMLEDAMEKYFPIVVEEFSDIVVASHKIQRSNPTRAYPPIMRGYSELIPTKNIIKVYP